MASGNVSMQFPTVCTVRSPCRWHQPVNTKDAADCEWRVTTAECSSFFLLDIINYIIAHNLSPNTEVPFRVNYPIQSRSRHEQQSWEEWYTEAPLERCTMTCEETVHRTERKRFMEMHEENQLHRTVLLFLCFNVSPVHSHMLFCHRVYMKLNPPSSRFVFYRAQLVSVRDVHKHAILLPDRFNPFKRICWQPVFNILYCQGAAEVCGPVIVNSWPCTSRKKKQPLALVNIIDYIIRWYIKNC